MHAVVDRFALVALLVIGVFALLGAWDYMAESARIFMNALDRYRKRKGD